MPSSVTIRRNGGARENDDKIISLHSACAGGVRGAGGLVSLEDPYQLQRFVDAQRDIYDRVETELRAGRKESHWMWFIFPQIAGLGQSPMAQKYAIASLAEAAAYLKHPVLGRRLDTCTQLVNQLHGQSIEDIFGHPDYLKFQSSMTLFARAADDNGVFMEALRKYFRSQFDRQTIERL